MEKKNDYYSPNYLSVSKLLQHERVSRDVWDCACGDGVVSEVLKLHGYSVMSTDSEWRGYGLDFDFMKFASQYNGDIVTVPPYNRTFEYVKRAYELIAEGHKVAALLPLHFLGGKKRYKFLSANPPQTVYILLKRPVYTKADGESKIPAATPCAWFVWQKGSICAPIIRWI